MPPAGESLLIGIYKYILYTTRKSRRNSYIPRHTIHRQGNKYRSVSYPVCEHVPLWRAR